MILNQHKISFRLIYNMTIFENFYFFLIWRHHDVTTSDRWPYKKCTPAKNDPYTIFYWFPLKKVWYPTGLDGWALNPVYNEMKFSVSAKVIRQKNVSIRYRWKFLMIGWNSEAGKNKEGSSRTLKNESRWFQKMKNSEVKTFLGTIYAFECLVMNIKHFARKG